MFTFRYTIYLTGAKYAECAINTVVGMREFRFQGGVLRLAETRKALQHSLNRMFSGVAQLTTSTSACHRFEPKAALLERRKVETNHAVHFGASVDA
ncbi:MAG: hypothetical protein NT138_16325 [Planctomycetales bacterium]|nr:hypothetical protein [Planctomycetales bacterium]